MKRMIPVSIIFVLILALTVYSSVMLDHATNEMIMVLEVAREHNNADDYEGAKKALDDFHEIFRRYEMLFSLFVRRDLVCNIHTNAATLYQYALKENKNDFNADIQKTIEHIVVIRHHVLRPA